MWAVFDFVARLVCFGAFVLVAWWLYQITREPSARNNFGHNSFPVHLCMQCGQVLGDLSAVHCDDCLELSHV